MGQNGGCYGHCGLIKLHFLGSSTFRFFLIRTTERCVPPLPIGQAPNHPRSTDPGTTLTPILHIIKVHFAAMTILWFLR